MSRRGWTWLVFLALVGWAVACAYLVLGTYDPVEIAEDHGAELAFIAWALMVGAIWFVLSAALVALLIWIRQSRRSS